jgi:phosphate transport system protein
MSPDAATGFRHFHDQLATLKQHLLDMSEKSEALIELAVDALLTSDQAKAEAVIAGDKEIDALEVEIEHEAVALRLIQQRADITPDPEIEDMARRARKMLSDALDAFIRADGTAGRAVCAEDDVVDALHDSVFRILLTHMMADPRTITPSLELFLVSRNLERVADLATNIGEDAVFLAEGKQIKHHYESGEGSRASERRRFPDRQSGRVEG